MSCHNDPSITVCRLNDLYVSGWSVEILLPKDNFLDWEIATHTARTFFQETINRCEEEQ
jgi:hypothetical protein